MQITNLLKSIALKNTGNASKNKHKLVQHSSKKYYTMKNFKRANRDDFATSICEK